MRFMDWLLLLSSPTRLLRHTNWRHVLLLDLQSSTLSHFLLLRISEWGTEGEIGHSLLSHWIEKLST